MLTPEEQNKGYLSFMNEVVDPVANNGAGAVVRRYQQPPAPVLPPPVQPSSVAPVAAPQASNPLLTYDQFAAQRGGNVDENAIREQTRRNMQAQIDATDRIYADLVARENEAGNARLDKVRALNVNSGLGGSSFATSADLTQRDKNSQVVKGIEAEHNLKVQEIYGRIDELARNEIAAKKAEALGNANAYSQYLDKVRGEAQGQLQQLAAGGVDISKLDAQRKAYLYQSAGYDPQYGDLLYNAMLPKPKQIDYKFEKLADGQGMFYGTDPATGQLKQIKVSVDLPPESTLVMAPDGTPLVFDKRSGVATVAPGFSQGQFVKPETPKSNLVTINGQTYTVDENGNYSIPNVPKNTPTGQDPTSQLTFLKGVVDEATKLADASGPNALTKWFGNTFVGDTAVKRLQKQIDTLRSNMLTLATDPNIKKFFGPQMSNADVELMTSAGTTLDAYNNDPETNKKELQRLKDLFNRMQQAIPANAGNTGSGTIIEYNGKQYQTDENGNFDPNSPLTSVGADTKQGSKGVTMMRTDRHNNPAAFTTDIAKIAGLKEGVDYTVGDPFSGGKYHTARLLGDPVDTTIKVIDRIGFYTQSGKPRWSYVNAIPQAKNWNSLSYDQKKNVVAQMYSHEGGSQLKKYFA